MMICCPTLCDRDVVLVTSCSRREARCARPVALGLRRCAQNDVLERLVVQGYSGGRLVNWGRAGCACALMPTDFAI
eukprot:3347101-Pyramimonas_sp.AAC.1